MTLQIERPFLEALHKENIFFLKAKSKEEALQTMTKGLYENGYLLDEGEFYEALIQREELISTGIGMGIAIPHAKVQGVVNFFVAIGILLEEGLDWGAIDGVHVGLIFMIGGPDRAPREYLLLLSSLTTYLKEENIRSALFRAKSREDVVKIFQSC